MKVIVRNPKRREVDLAGSRQVRDVLKALDLSPESHIVVRGASLLTRDALVKDEETIEVISAISGGA